MPPVERPTDEQLRAACWHVILYQRESVSSGVQRPTIERLSNWPEPDLLRGALVVLASLDQAEVDDLQAQALLDDLRSHAIVVDDGDRWHLGPDPELAEVDR